MAKANIPKFLGAVMTDPVLAKKVAALAAEHGYDFTVAELLEYAVARPLSDEEAAGVAGGGRPRSLDGMKIDHSFGAPWDGWLQP